MEYNYAQSPPWAQPTSPQNQGYNQNQYMQTSAPNTSGNAYYGAPNPVSPSNSYTTPYTYASPSGVSATNNRSENHHASPALSPGDWNTPSPSNPSPTQYGQAVSPVSQSASPSSVRSAPFMYTSTPQKLSLPKKLGTVEKTELDIGRERVAGARALCLMQETFARGPEPKSAPVRRPVAQSTTSTNITAKPKVAPTKQYPSMQQPQRRFFTTSKEKLATSTRKKKTISSEEDFENISDFKCQLDFDRQKDAQKKALKMLSYF